MEGLTPYLTVKDIAEHLQIGKNKAYELCSLDDFPSIKIGSSYRVDQKKYLKWLKTHEDTGIQI